MIHRNDLLFLAAFLNAVLLTIPIFYFIFSIIFPIIYFLLIFITKDDEFMFFWAFWILEIILLIFITKYLDKKFNKISKTAIILLSFFSLTLFTIFGIRVFPYSSSFPSSTISDMNRKDENDVADALLKATNKYNIPLFYSSDKAKIESAFKNYMDTLTKRDYSNDEFNPIKAYFGSYNKEILDNIINITVDTIIYDTSFLKYFVTVIYQTKSNQYFGQGFIGYRTTANSSLKLFPFQHISSTGEASTISECRTWLRKMYFIEIRKVSQYLKFDDMIKYKYSPLDKEFWNGIFFTKGPDIDSLYYFETERNFEKKDRTNIVPPLIVD